MRLRLSDVSPFCHRAFQNALVKIGLDIQVFYKVLPKSTYAQNDSYAVIWSLYMHIVFLPDHII